MLLLIVLFIDDGGNSLLVSGGFLLVDLVFNKAWNQLICIHIRILIRRYGTPHIAYPAMEKGIYQF